MKVLFSWEVYRYNDTDKLMQIKSADNRILQEQLQNKVKLVIYLLSSLVFFT